MFTLLGFTQHVRTPTHKHGGWLDVVLSEDDLPVSSVKVVNETGTASDHYLVNFKGGGGGGVKGLTRVVVGTTQPLGNVQLLD